MTFVLESIARNVKDATVHDAFIKYSKGTFRQRYLVQSKKGKEGWTLKTSADYVNSIVHAGLERASGSIRVTGAIIATFKVAEHATFPTQGLKQFMGIKQTLVDDDIPVAQLLDLMQKQPRAFYALSFSFPGGSIKTKAKAPKSAKPSTKETTEVKPDFCVLKTLDESFVNHILLDVPAAKSVTLSHSVVITDIELPQNIADPVQLREQSIRVGSMVRTCVADDVTTKKEYPFRA
ncbi:hypothetical protein EXS73_00715 [Candidatus Pacearchaeota archaeon]|nr:hypothetical protein [Candidatus Pacearchaeota archaeon]